jgi:hypothetical protein
MSSVISRSLPLVACFLAFVSLSPCLASEIDAQAAGSPEQGPPTSAPDQPNRSAAAQGGKVAEPQPQRPQLLVSDQPNTLGIAEDAYERHPYMDFVLSVRYPIAYESRTEGRTSTTGLWMPYLSFTGRMSQYFNRRSAPVVTKQFNPKLMVRVYQSEPPEGKRIWVDDRAFNYYDFGYAHESNGQYVNSPEAFDAIATNFGSTDVAQDYIHRGWDYLDYRKHFHLEKQWWSVFDVELKYFLNHGLAQTNIMETYSWEAPRSITHISQVDGIRLTGGVELEDTWFKNASISWITGYTNPVRYNTLRVESTFSPLSHYFGVPVILWFQSGYDTSVARFYLHSWYAGMAFSFETEQ